MPFVSNCGTPLFLPPASFLPFHIFRPIEAGGVHFIPRGAGSSAGRPHTSGCRVAERGYPRPAPEEPCMGLSIHTARASSKASIDTQLYNFFLGMLLPMAIEMVHLKVACRVRATVSPFHNVAESPRC